jgi:glutaryl-CoA dehydrogenase
VIDGQEKWLGNGAVSGSTIVWVRDEAEGQSEGFLVEQLPEGCWAEVIRGKGALLSNYRAERVLDGVRVGWTALGPVTTMLEAALSPATRRIQFAKPIVGHRTVPE